MTRKRTRMPPGQCFLAADPPPLLFFSSSSRIFKLGGWKAPAHHLRFSLLLLFLHHQRGTRSKTKHITSRSCVTARSLVHASNFLVNTLQPQTAPSSSRFTQNRPSKYRKIDLQHEVPPLLRHPRAGGRRDRPGRHRADRSRGRRTCWQQGQRRRPL